MVENLRAGEKQADGGRVLYRQRGEIGAERPRPIEQFAHLHQRGLTGEIELALGIDAAADGVLQLRGVYPEMHPAHAQPIGAHRGGGGEQGEGGGIIGFGGEGFQIGDQRGEAGELVGVIGGEGVGGGGYLDGIA